MRRLFIVAITLVALVSVAGCRHLGPGNDSGAKTSTVVYSVTGSGVTTVSYAATATPALTRRTDVSLPFAVTVTTRDHSETKYRVIASASQGPLACSITVNHVRVVSMTASAGRPITCSFLK